MRTKIGIVGGGQLARMLAFSAKRMGFHVTVLDPTPASPAGQVSDEQIVASLDDAKAMAKLAKKSDIVTIEWELANPTLLKKMVASGTPVHPSTETLAVIKDKLTQKEFLRKARIPVADFLPVITKEDIIYAAKQFGFPLLLKARVGAYDGRGNVVIKKQVDIAQAMQKLAGKHLYVEKYIPFVKELAVMVARNTRGAVAVYPVVETIHKNNILHTVFAPAQVSKTVAKKSQNLAQKTVAKLKGAGVFGIEMFLTQKGDVLINEIAPRVHNSGHYTIEPCATSQFEQHIRAVMGLPLGKTTLLHPAAVMINILGTRNGEVSLGGLEKALTIPNVYIHVYGKSQVRMERKMGHITTYGKTHKEAFAKAKRARLFLTL